MSEPHIIRMRARDVEPYYFGLWCRIDGSEPFINEIVRRTVTDDGKIKWMMDSFNFDFHDPDELVDVVPISKVSECAASNRETERVAFAKKMEGL